MSIDNELYKAIESNDNIKEKEWFNNNLQFVKEVYNTYGIEYDFSNALDIIKNINIVEVEDEIKYDKESNTLQIGKSSNPYYDMCKSFIQIASQDGLSRIDKAGKKEWDRLNEIIIDRLILNTTGITKKEDSEDEKYAKEDEIMYKMTRVVPYDKLISYFAYSQGDKLYSEYFDQSNDKSLV